MLHAIGVIISIDTLRRFQHERMENYPAWVGRALRDNAGAMMNLYIDDYTAIHGIVCVSLLFNFNTKYTMAFLVLITMNISSVPRKQRRNLKADGKFFATVCIKPVPSVAAIAIPPEVRFTGKLSLGPFEERLKSTFVYASSITTLQRLLSTFIVEQQRVTVEERLQTHTYEASPALAMEGAIVLDVKQMPLKSHDEYLDVLRATVANTPALMAHLKVQITEAGSCESES